MGAFIGVVIAVAGAFMLVTSATFWSMARKGKSPDSSKDFALLFGLSGASLLTLQGLQFARVLPEHPAIVASALVAVGGSVGVRLLKARHKIRGK